MNVEPKQILKKASLIENQRKESSRNQNKKQWKDLERHENVRGNMKVTLGKKSKVEDLFKTWLVFFEKNLSKIANLDQKTCKSETVKGKLGKDTITSPLYRIN